MPVKKDPIVDPFNVSGYYPLLARLLSGSRVAY